jgi:hypothetical protein
VATPGRTKRRAPAARWRKKDWIEGVALLPENLIYNTTAPGIIHLLNKAKPAARRGQIMLINASQEFERGRPKNFIPDESIRKIANAFHRWEPVEKFARVIALDQAEKNDYNLSPSRYVHTGEAEQHRNVQRIIDDLASLEAEAESVGAELNGILKSLGYTVQASKGGYDGCSSDISRHSATARETHSGDAAPPSSKGLASGPRRRRPAQVTLSRRPCRGLWFADRSGPLSSVVRC